MLHSGPVATGAEGARDAAHVAWAEAEDARAVQYLQRAVKEGFKRKGRLEDVGLGGVLTEWWSSLDQSIEQSLIVCLVLAC